MSGRDPERSADPMNLPAPHRLGRPAAALLLSTLLAAASVASPAAAAWTARGSGSRAVAEAASQVPGSRLRLSCEETAKLYLYPPRAWDGNNLDPTYLDIDGERIAVTADPVDEGVILSDRPNGAVGVTASLLARMKRGRVLVISGPATARIVPAQLTFPLGDAAQAIASFERSCGA